jgi:hypothetical protein
VRAKKRGTGGRRRFLACHLRDFRQLACGRPNTAHRALSRECAMLILKLGFAALALLGLHETLLHYGDRMGANVITGAVAFLILLIIGLTKESFV